jgi:recombination protein RecR
MDYNGKSSKLLEDAVSQFSTLPGIGKKTALRFALHLLKKSEEDVEVFVNTIFRMKQDTKFCKICNNLSDTDFCSICEDKSRDTSKICVVENIHDVMAIESTSQYNGVYHVLGGIISPMEGIAPSDLNIQKLVERSETENISEIILALPTTMEGDTTNYYISKKIKNPKLEITILARGVAIGNELQYTDEITLGQSIINRKPFSVK